jgi:MFS family permease
MTISASSELEAPAAGSQVNMRKVAFASVIGTTVEWYDLFIFATASALVFNKIFFPEFDELIGTLLAFGTFASAYGARIVGAALFGHFGDKLGRKSMLLISLLAMGLATFAIGLLPDYASIGLWAPVLLLTLRLIQGLALGGEWGGAVLMAVEHAPKPARTLWIMGADWCAGGDAYRKPRLSGHVCFFTAGRSGELGMAGPVSRQRTADWYRSLYSS